MDDFLTRVIARIQEERNSIEHNQLSVYVGNMPMRLVDPDAPENQLMGYDEASQLPLERLRELFTEDDFGAAWELFTSEQTEWYENDEGRIATYDRVLAILLEETESAYSRESARFPNFEQDTDD